MSESAEEYKPQQGPKKSPYWRVRVSVGTPTFLQQHHRFNIIEETTEKFQLTFLGKNASDVHPAIGTSVPLDFIDRQFMQSDEFQLGPQRFRLNLKIARESDRFEGRRALYGIIDRITDGIGPLDETEMGVFGAEEENGTIRPGV